MRTLCLIFLLLIISIKALATSVKIYRWVDENNIVHFSQHQPPHDNYTELTMTETFVPKNNDAGKLQIANKHQVQDISADFQEKCAIAQANIETLTKHDKVQFTDKDGQTKVLNQEEKAIQLANSEKQAEVYCRQQ
ncbi:DUF4124 domain-containing protein [Thalassomonas actiniarum]|uniref:DUF4124 domain-containing protein n=1 Tax=Thalassomonas actiniarum TaxID=485447 RepID=A0AAE9YPQ2_9GAMM|nr:DUF4124 domain-containing protein [Thalassomonas actiniarum]WDD97953.1 DUF4124 domain-containing protein [Thalassomonas actiniarum]